MATVKKETKVTLELTAEEFEAIRVSLDNTGSLDASNWGIDYDVVMSMIESFETIRL